MAREGFCGFFWNPQNPSRVIFLCQNLFQIRKSSENDRYIWRRVIEINSLMNSLGDSLSKPPRGKNRIPSDELFRRWTNRLLWEAKANAATRRAGLKKPIQNLYLDISSYLKNRASHFEGHSQYVENDVMATFFSNFLGWEFNEYGNWRNLAEVGRNYHFLDCMSSILSCIFWLELSRVEYFDLNWVELHILTWISEGSFNSWFEFQCLIFWRIFQFLISQFQVSQFLIVQSFFSDFLIVQTLNN